MDKICLQPLPKAPLVEAMATIQEFPCDGGDCDCLQANAAGLPIAISVRHKVWENWSFDRVVCKYLGYDGLLIWRDYRRVLGHDFIIIITVLARSIMVAYLWLRVTWARLSLHFDLRLPVLVALFDSDLLPKWQLGELLQQLEFI